MQIITKQQWRRNEGAAITRPLYPLLFAPVPVLSAAVIYIWQIPWWSGFRLAYLCLFTVGCLLTIFWQPWAKFHRRFPRLAKPLNILTGVMLVFMLLATLIPALIRDTAPHKAPSGLQAGPDIYFIVLDSYTGSQALLDRFSYDNSAFLESLQALGFHTGDCRSRYTYTSPELASIFNGGGEVPTETRTNWRLVQRSLLRTTLEARGYDTIAFATGYDWDELHDAAYYLEPDLRGPTEFELFVLGDPSWDDQLGKRARTRTLYLLANLDTAADLPGSQFTFAHIVQPHPPFVFNSDGSPLADEILFNPGWDGNSSTSVRYTPENYVSGYVGQAEYISNAILPPLRLILAKDPQALIILIGDHGSWYSTSEEEARSTLCAVYGDLPLDPVEAVRKIVNKPAPVE